MGKYYWNLITRIYVCDWFKFVYLIVIVLFAVILAVIQDTQISKSSIIDYLNYFWVGTLFCDIMNTLRSNAMLFHSDVLI